jgi:hypothetical protein
LSTSGSPPSQSAAHLSRHITELLEIIWADFEFWELVKRPESDYWGASEAVASRFGLGLPSLESGVWQWFAKDERRRRKLFEVIASHPWRLYPLVQSVSMPEDSLLLEILHPYIGVDTENPRRKLASMQLPAGVLRRLCESGARLAKDAKWCLDNPNKLPPVSVPHRRGRPSAVERARVIEQLAALIRKYRSETDERIAKLYLEGNPSAREKHYPQTLRKMAGEAKRLLEVREDFPSVHYIGHENYGRRPSRKIGPLAK